MSVPTSRLGRVFSQRLRDRGRSGVDPRGALRGSYLPADKLEQLSRELCEADLRNAPRRNDRHMLERMDFAPDWSAGDDGLRAFAAVIDQMQAG